MAIRAGIQYLWNPTPFYAHGVSVWGYNIRALHIPCIALATGARPGEPLTMYDDAAFIADQVTCLEDAACDVLLGTHSYGGMPAE